MPRVLGMVGASGEADGCYLWRLFMPMGELNRQGYAGAGWDYFDNELVEIVWRAFDAVVLPRLSWEPEDIDGEERWFDLMRREGKAVIYEVDDDLFSDPFVRRMIETHDKTPERAETVRASLVRTLRRCDGVTVSTEYLRTIVEELTDRPVVVVPNFIDLRWFRWMRENNRRWIAPLTIGWAGGTRPDRDVEEMAVAWGRIAKRFPDVTFVVMGHQAQVIHDHVPADRVKAVPWMPIDKYPAGLTNIDIGCCPLSPEPFNRAKTYIKAMEYAAMGAAVVASPTVYRQIIDDGKNGTIAETADEWEEALAGLITSANRRQRMAQALEGKVERHHSIEGNAWRWLAAWGEIIEDFKRRQRVTVILPRGVRYARPATRAQVQV